MARPSIDNAPWYRDGRRLRLQKAAERAYDGGDLPRVHERAEALGLTLANLAKHAKVDLQTVRDVAAGRVSRVALPFFRALPALALALETDEDDLYPATWRRWAEARLLGPDPHPLRLARMRAGLTVEQLAARARVEYSHITRLEAGEMPWVSPARGRRGLTRIGAVVGMHVDALLAAVGPGRGPIRKLSARPAGVRLPAGWPDVWTWRASVGLTRKGLALAARVSLDGLKRLEHGQALDVREPVLLANLARLAEALGRPQSRLATQALLKACRAARQRKARARASGCGQKSGR